MLQYGSVEPHVLEILKRLMQIKELNDFHLVGGTALSLYYGHRLSVDLDLFSINDFDNESLVHCLEQNFNAFSYRNVNNPIGIFGYIDGVKIDFVKHHHHPQILPPILESGIRIASLPDLMAMKIAAILKRGVKKDFWDIAEILQDHNVEDFVNYYTQKYPGQQLLISIPFALTYFEDAEESEDPVSLNGQDWDSVKKSIQVKVNEYLR